MANCSSKTLSTIELSCEGSTGGIKRVLVAPRIVIQKPETGENGVIDGEKIFAKEEGVHFVEFNFRPETGSLSMTGTSDIAQGNSSVTSTLTLQFSRMEATKRVALQQAIATGAVVLVQDFNDEVWYLGFDRPVYTSETTGATGQAMTDFNGYTLTLEDKSAEYPHPVKATDTVLDKLLVSVPTE